MTNGNQKDAADDAKPMLPPLAALESPADQGFGAWGLASSLRSGPLSPAMLAGPASQQTPSLGLGAFDSSFVRTGLTPDVSRTGLTPLIGGPGGYPPPSPNTAALFALVNGASSGSNVAITPGTLNAITGALNQSLNAIHQPTSMTLEAQNQPLMDAAHQQSMNQQNQFVAPQQETYSSHDSASHAISNAASALYLLSQQQGMQRQQNQVNPSAVSGQPQRTNTSQSPTSSAAPLPTRRATKRKTTDTPVAPAPRGKKAKGSSGGVATRGASRRRSSKVDDQDDDQDEDDEDDDDDDAYMEGNQPISIAANGRTNSTAGKAASKKPETEEEKRRNFLERNRQAALKCRQRKKAWLQALQAKVEFLSVENERLSKALVASREEIARLSQAVVARGGAPSALLNTDLGVEVSPNGVERARSDSSASTTAGQAIHVNVSLPGTNNAAPPNMATGLGHAHSHSQGVLQHGQGQVMGHGRSHSHGHVMPTQNGVTVGGRGYGY